MKLQIKLLLFSALCALQAYITEAKLTSKQTLILQSLSTMSLSTWVNLGKNCDPKVAIAPLCSAKKLLDALQTFSAVKAPQFAAASAALWVDKNIANITKFEPFTQKLVVPSNSTLFTWGDLHGDIQALARSLEKLRDDGVINDAFGITQPDTYFLFLGDYTDRGQQGAEVLYSLMRLKIANPDRVYLVRGNHEDLDLNARLGFGAELKRKYPAEVTTILKEVERVYNALPVAIFAGTQDGLGLTHYMQCCHGGLELGYNPQKLFTMPRTLAYEKITQLHRLSNFKKLKPHIHASQAYLFAGNVIPTQYVYDVAKNGLYPTEIGFMWNDFSAIGDTSLSWDNQKHRGCGCSYGQNLTETLFRFYNAGSMHKLHGVIRAHQHNPTMPGLLNNNLNKGLYKLPWFVPVFTTVASKQYVPGFCTFLKVTTAENFHDWSIIRLHCNAQQAWELDENTLENYASI